MRKDTRTDLVEELKKLKQYPEIIYMISEAQAGEYHDYKNKKYVCGKTEAITRLDTIARFYNDQTLIELRNQIMNGDFDEVADEEDRASMRKDILENTSNANEAEHLIKALNL